MFSNTILKNGAGWKPAGAGRTTNKSLILVVWVAFVLFSLTPSSANADAILNIDGGGQLTGAQNVNVDGTFYDVNLVDASCFDEIPGVLFPCAGTPAPFDFTTSESAEAAAQALLDQVFLDGADGAFDTNPELTFGCTVLTICSTFVPFGFSTQGGGFGGGSITRAAVQAAENVVPGQTDLFGNPIVDTVRSTIVDRDRDLASDPARVYARFALAASQPPANGTESVPEPGTLMLFGAGLMGMAAIRQRRQLR